MKSKIILILIILFSVSHSYSQFTQYSSSSSTSGFSEECYCSFEYDYSAMLYAWNQMIESQRQAWLNERLQVFKEEIEDRLNRNFSNFEEAQHAFFKERSGRDFIQYTLNDKEDYYENVIKEEEVEREMTFARSKALELRLNDLTNGTSNYNFGDIIYYSERFMDKSWSYINSSYDNRIAQYNDAKNGLESLLLQRDKLDKVIQDETFDEYVVDEYIDHYNSQGLLEKVEAMAIYMIEDNLGALQILNPTAQEKIYNPNDYYHFFELLDN